MQSATMTSHLKPIRSASLSQPGDRPGFSLAGAPVPGGPAREPLVSGGGPQTAAPFCPPPARDRILLLGFPPLSLHGCCPELAIVAVAAGLANK